jgi:hypothetical protein
LILVRWGLLTVRKRERDPALAGEADDDDERGRLVVLILGRGVGVSELVEREWWFGVVRRLNRAPNIPPGEAEDVGGGDGVGEEDEEDE